MICRIVGHQSFLPFLAIVGLLSFLPGHSTLTFNADGRKVVRLPRFETGVKNMSSSDEDVVLAPRVRIMQVILLALVAGCLIFLVIALVVRQGGGGGPPAATPIITYIALASGVIALAGSIMVPRWAAKEMLRKLARESPANHASDVIPDSFTRETGKLAELFRTYLFMTAAPLEGGIFFLLIAYLVEGSLLSIIGAIVLLVFLGSKFPTRPAVERWIEQQRDLLQQERMGV
jgi:hypothetical protein